MAKGYTGVRIHCYEEGASIRYHAKAYILLAMIYSTNRWRAQNSAMHYSITHVL